MLTLLITAFLLTARTEYSTSNFYLKGVRTKLLSENAINLVIAQLREGARSRDIEANIPIAWASQPGMIRTYKNDGTANKFYKLYSWDNMVGTGAFDETQATEQPDKNWASLPGLYTDLNEPVNGLYPHHRSLRRGQCRGLFLYDPRSNRTTQSSNALPMPVKWLYVLKDGSITIGTAGSGTAVIIPGANTGNPVIGRIAFWADDETSKVNINTASEGTFWDIPIASNTEDLGVISGTPYGYALSYPGGEEFQRVPGHPATTSLSTVFGYGSAPVLPVTSTASWPLTAANYASIFAPYYTVTPRYAAGGSQAGTQPAAANFVPPAYRLYDSIDELVFDPNRTPLSHREYHSLSFRIDASQPNGTKGPFDNSSSAGTFTLFHYGP